MTDPANTPTPLDIAAEAQAVQTASDAGAETKLVIGAAENLAAGVLPAVAAAAGALVPGAGPEIQAAAAIGAAELTSGPDAQAAAANVEAAAAVALGIQAADTELPKVTPAPSPVVPLVLLAILGLFGSVYGADPGAGPVSASGALDRLWAVLVTIAPWVITALGAMLAAAKLIQPEVAAKNPHLGAIIAAWDTGVDALYSVLTSKAGLAEDAVTVAKAAGLTSLLTQVHAVTADPLVAPAIQAAIATLPSAEADVIKAIVNPLPKVLALTAVSAVSPVTSVSNAAAQK